MSNIIPIKKKNTREKKYIEIERPTIDEGIKLLSDALDIFSAGELHPLSHCMKNAVYALILIYENFNGDYYE